MPDKTVLDLDAITTLATGDYLLISRVGINKKMLATDFRASTIGALGSIATQNANAVNITGGTITGLSGSMTVGGNITAAAFIGNGAGLTGIGTGTGGIINTGSTTIGADSDSDGVGVIDLQTRATTRLRVLNGGDVEVFNKLGINNPAPSARVHINPSYLSTVSAGEMMMKFTPPNNASDFGFMLTSILEGGDPNDDVVWWGWNVDDHIAPATEPSLHFAMERSFGSGDSANFEVHLEVHPKDGGGPRPWSWTINRKTGAASVSTGARAVFGDGRSFVQFQDSEDLFAPTFGSTSATPFRIVSDSITFETFANGGTPAKQLQILPSATDSLQSTIVFGGAGNGLQLTKYPGFGILVVNDLNAGTLAEIMVRRVRLPGGTDGLYVNSIQVISDQGAAVADATSTSDVVAQLNALLSRLRTHGLIAT